MKVSTRTRQTALLTGIFFFSLILFSWGLCTQEIIGFDSRFYLFAQEMLQNGPSWFPTTYHHPYPDYPAASTWLIYLNAHVFGELNKWIAVFPSAIAAALTVVFTYLIGAERSTRLGLYAVFFLFLTVAFFKAARSISLDMYPTLVTAWCFYLVCKNKSLLWIFPLFVAGFIFRGPIGLVIPAGVICIYYLLDRRYQQFILTGIASLIILLACTAFLLDAANHEGGYLFLQSVLRMEVLGRMGKSALPFYFYFTDSVGSYALGYPLAVLTTLGVWYYTVKKIPLEDGKWLGKLIGWVLVILIGMSIPGDKKIRYVLPMAPALALLAAYPFALTLKETFFRSVRAICLKLFLYFPILFFLVAEIIFYRENHAGLHVGIQYLPLICLLIAMQLLSFWFYYGYINRINVRDTTVLFFAALSFVTTEMMVLEPIELYLDRAHEFVAAMETERTNAHAQLVFYHENADSMPIKFLINMPKQEKPIFIAHESELAAFSEQAYFVTSAEYFMALPPSLQKKLQIIGSERLGHVRVVVFTKKK